jgi:hypothetical protein
LPCNARNHSWDIRASGASTRVISWPLFLAARLKPWNVCGADLSGFDEEEHEEKQDIPQKKMRKDASDEKSHKEFNFSSH